MSERLPPELLARVLSFLRPPAEAFPEPGDLDEWKADLCACTLVCHRWKAVALEPLHEIVTLAMVRDPDVTDDYVFLQGEEDLFCPPADYQSFLSENPTVAGCIRSLSIQYERGRLRSGKPGSAARLNLSTFLGILACMPRLEEVKLCGIALVEPEDSSSVPNARDPILLKRLTIDSALPLHARLDTARSTSRILRHFEVTDELLLRNYIGGAVEPWCASSTRKLRRLELQACQTRPETISSLLSAPTDTARELYVWERPGSRLRKDIQSVLDEFGSALVGFGWYLFGSDDGQGPLDLAPCLNLETLKLDFLFMDLDSGWAALVDIFTPDLASSCPKLHLVELSVQLIFHDLSNVQGDGLRPVEDSLLALRQCTGTTVFRLGLDSPSLRLAGDDVGEISAVKKWFPRLVEQGMILYKGERV